MKTMYVEIIKDDPEDRPFKYVCCEGSFKKGSTVKVLAETETYNGNVCYETPDFRGFYKVENCKIVTPNKSKLENLFEKYIDQAREISGGFEVDVIFDCETPKLIQDIIKEFNLGE